MSISKPFDVTILNASRGAIRRPGWIEAAHRLRKQCALFTGLRIDGQELRRAATSGGEPDSRTVRRPLRFVVQSRRIDQLSHPRAVGTHDIDVPISVPIGAERQAGAVPRPGGVEIGASIAGDLGRPRAVDVDQIDVTGDGRSRIEGDPLPIRRPGGMERRGLNRFKSAIAASLFGCPRTRQPAPYGTRSSQESRVCSSGADPRWVVRPSHEPTVGRRCAGG
jgi:hypothetical protein